MHVLVIGSGKWSRVHLDALRAIRSIDGITLVGRNRLAVEAVAADYPNTRVFVGSWQDALTRSDIDLVDIVVPHHLHYPVAIAAIAAGKHVICEKPGSLTLHDWDNLHAAATDASRRFLVIQNQLYDPSVQRIGQVIRSGAVGRPFLLVENNYAAHATSYRQDGWRTRIDFAGGGVLIDGGYHMVYKHLDWLAQAGAPLWVDASAAQLHISANGTFVPEQGEDFASYTVGYDGPLRINASHAWTLTADPLQPRLGFIAGSEATLEWVASREAPLHLHTMGKGSTLLASPTSLDRRESLKRCLADYVESIRTGRPPQHGSAILARQTLQLILSVYRSARDGSRELLQ